MEIVGEEVIWQQTFHECSARSCLEKEGHFSHRISKSLELGGVVYSKAAPISEQNQSRFTSPGACLGAPHPQWQRFSSTPKSVWAIVSALPPLANPPSSIPSKWVLHLVHCEKA